MRIRIHLSRGFRAGDNADISGSYGANQQAPPPSRGPLGRQAPKIVNGVHQAQAPRAPRPPMSPAKSRPPRVVHANANKMSTSLQGVVAFHDWVTDRGLDAAAEYAAGEDFEGRISALETAVTGLETLTTSHTTSIVDLETLTTSLTDSIVDLEAAVSDLETLTTSLTDSIIDLEAAVGDLETLTTSHTTSIVDLETLTTSHTTSIVDLEFQVFTAIAGDIDNIYDEIDFLMACACA